MNHYHELPTLDISFQQARAERPGRQIERIPSISALRLLKGVESAFRWSVGRVSRWRHRRTAIRKLQALSDHHLTDIGLDRSQVVSPAEEFIKTGGRPV